MTVAELITILQTLPLDLPVKLYNDDRCVHEDVVTVKESPRWVNDDWKDMDSPVVEILAY